jgi:hypothetical protein
MIPTIELAAHDPPGSGPCSPRRGWALHQRFSANHKAPSTQPVQPGRIASQIAPMIGVSANHLLAGLAHVTLQSVSRGSQVCLLTF